MRRSFASLRPEEVFDLVPVQDITRWSFAPPERVPSDLLPRILQRLDCFELTGSEPAKVMLIDTLLGEVIPSYPQLKVWKGEPLEAATVGGVADYLIAPKRAYVKTPLLCAIEAKRDDFQAGEIQCVAEMAVCQQNNIRDGLDIEIHGIVSNGQVWVFYKLTRTPEVLVSGLFTMNDLIQTLGRTGLRVRGLRPKRALNSAVVQV